MSFLDDIHKQPKYVREIMFAFCVVITVSLVGIIWFRSFEEDLFVKLNPEPEKQEQFFAERAKRTPVAYATITKALNNLQATFYNALGLFGDMSSTEVRVEEEYKGDTYKLPLSGDRE